MRISDWSSDVCSSDLLRAAFMQDETPPACRDCGGLVKQATISFGQAMPQDAMLCAQNATLAADLFLAIGSSLVVYPAAGFPILAKQNGTSLAILNRDPTDLDPDRKSTRLNSSHSCASRMPSSA